MNKELEFLEEKHGDNSWGHYPPSKREVAQWLQEWTEKQFAIHSVVDSKRFTETDLLNGYQAGCIEGLDDCCDLGLDDLKEIKEDGKKWVKRYTE